MPGLLQYAAAGALGGAGKGLAVDAEAKREAARDALRAERAAEEARKNRDFQGEQGRLGREHQTTLQQDRQTFDEGQNDLNRRQQTQIADKQIGAARDRANETAGRYAQFGVDSEGFQVAINQKGEAVRVTGADGQPIRPAVKPQDMETKQLADGTYVQIPKTGGSARTVTMDDGSPAVGKPPRDPDKLTLTQRNVAINAARRAATVKVRGGLGEELDPEAYADELVARGVEIDAPLRKQIEDGIRKDIAGKVSRDASGRKNMWKGEKEEFDGVTRAEWEQAETERRIAEKMADIFGRGDDPTPKPKAPAGKTESKTSGTREDPYKPTTREEFTAIPSGAIYINPADGKPYRKN
ncbi:hypothetical protein [Thalassobaculum sp.]